MLIPILMRESIFDVVKTYFMEKNIPLSNITACATDGAASMVGRYRGFIAHLKLAVPSLFCIHCVVHRQHLVSKKWGGGGRLSTSINILINWNFLCRFCF